METNKKILIVDDTKNVRETLSDIFQEKGFKNVLTASNGKTGLDLAKKELPDVILMDIDMPNMPGGDAVAELQKSLNTKDIPVIFISGIVGKDKEGKEAVNIRGQWYPAIGKPFNHAVLIERIEEYTKRKVKP